MNTNSTQYKAAVKLGESLIGKTAQSRLLTEIGSNGNKVLSAPQKITSYEIVEEFMQPSLMVTIGGECVFEDLLINISQ